MSKPKVYLAGPIASCTYREATAWRRAVALALSGRAECLDPMRDNDPSPPLSSRAIVSRDLADVQRADVVLMALPSVSVGTLVELGWATAMGKLVILWLPHGVPDALRYHPFILECASATVATIDEAVAVVRSFLNLPSAP